MIDAILNELQTVSETNAETYKKNYESCLYRKDMVTMFEDLDRKTFQGKIQGVSNNGMLLVKLSDNTLKEFRLKEIKMLY